MMPEGSLCGDLGRCLDFVVAERCKERRTGHRPLENRFSTGITNAGGHHNKRWKASRHQEGSVISQKDCKIKVDRLY